MLELNHAQRLTHTLVGPRSFVTSPPPVRPVPRGGAACPSPSAASAACGRCRAAGPAEASAAAAALCWGSALCNTTRAWGHARFDATYNMHEKLEHVEREWGNWRAHSSDFTVAPLTGWSCRCRRAWRWPSGTGSRSDPWCLRGRGWCWQSPAGEGEASLHHSGATCCRRYVEIALRSELLLFFSGGAAQRVKRQKPSSQRGPTSSRSIQISLK